MTFFVTDTQRLISEAGGPAPIGMKLKQYFWSICRDLATHIDFVIQPRTLERAWREDWLSSRVEEALKKLAHKRACDAEIQRVARFEEILERIQKSATSTEHQRTVAAQISQSIACIRQCVVARYRNDAVARCYALIEASELDTTG